MKGPNRQRQLSFIAAVAVALLAGDRLIWMPLARSWNERAERVAELEQSIRHGSTLAERAEVIRNRWEKMRSRALRGTESSAENEVLKAFERWSQGSRISIASIRPQWKRGGEDYITLECRADAFGDMEAISRFIYEIERDPLPLRMELVEITARDTNGQQLALELQVSGLLLLEESGR